MDEVLPLQHWKYSNIHAMRKAKIVDPFTRSKMHKICGRKRKEKKKIFQKKKIFEWPSNKGGKICIGSLEHANDA